MNCTIKWIVFFSIWTLTTIIYRKESKGNWQEIIPTHYLLVRKWVHNTQNLQGQPTCSLKIHSDFIFAEISCYTKFFRPRWIPAANWSRLPLRNITSQFVKLHCRSVSSNKRYSLIETHNIWNDRQKNGMQYYICIISVEYQAL